MATKFDMTGERYERLTVLSYAGNGCWLCQCTCGTLREVPRGAMLHGQKSCGCLRLELARSQPRMSSEHRKEMDRQRGIRYRQTQKFAQTRARYEASEAAAKTRARWAQSERCKELARKHNPEKKARYRAALHGLATHLSRAEWERVKAAWGYECAYCGSGGRLEREHVVPISRGGADDCVNVLPACRSCNAKKKARLLEEAASKLKIQLDEFMLKREAALARLQEAA